MDCKSETRPREFLMRSPGHRPDAIAERLVGHHPDQLIDFSRGFLRANRDLVRFVWRFEDTWYAVRMELRFSADSQGEALVTYAPVVIPYGVTTREVDILTLIALGMTNGQIAKRLGTSPRTVSTQVERLLVKLGQRTRGGLAALVVDTALIRLPVPGGVDDVPCIGPVEVEQALLRGTVEYRKSSAPQRLKRRPFLLGTVVPSVGPIAADGVEASRGSTLAVEQINARGGIGGRLIEHLLVDVDMTDGDSVCKSFASLFDQEVDAITTSYVNAENPIVLDLVADFGRPFLHLATFQDQVDLVRNDPIRYGMVFQTCPSETHYGSGLIRFLDSLVIRKLWRPRSRRIVTIELDALSTKTTNETFLSRAQASGWAVHDVIRVPLGLKDWSDVVKHVSAADPAVIMITHFVAGDVIALQAALHASQTKALVYHVYGASVPQFAAHLGPAAEGVIWASVTGLYDDLLGDQFRQVYTQRFGEVPGWAQASAAYDQVGVLAAAWAATDTQSAGEVIRYLRQSAYRGLNGVYYLGQPGQSSRGYPDEVPDPSLGQAQMIYQYQGGQSRALSPDTNGRLAEFVLPAGVH